MYKQSYFYLSIFPIETSYVTYLSFTCYQISSEQIFVEHRFMTTKITLQTIFFKSHPYLCSDCTTFKYKTSLISLRLMCYNNTTELNNLGITPMFQMNLSNINFHFLCKKMSSIYIALLIILKFKLRYLY